MSASRYTNIAENASLTDCLRLLRSPQVGAVTFFHLVSKAGGVTAALDALPYYYKKAGKHTASALPSQAQIEDEIAATEKAGARYIAYGHTDYPALLQHIYDPPPLLIARGPLSPACDKPAVALVGARNASANGRQLARSFAHALAEAGIRVISGLARGIDSEAHKGAKPENTIAVIGTGINVTYPRENAALQEAIAEQGCLLSEYPIGTQPLGRQFPARNRIIAGMTCGTLVVEASLKSGSLITARLAGEYGREVWAIPGSPLDSRSQGGNRLLKQGAGLAETPEDIIQAVHSLPDNGLTPARAFGFSSPANEFEEEDISPLEPVKDPATLRQNVLQALSPTPIMVDELCMACQIAPNQLLTILLELELTGQVERFPGQRVAKVVQAA